MKVYTNIEYKWDDEQNKLVETSSESYDYEGRVDKADIAPYDYAEGSQFGGDMGVYNYWLNLLPPDVQQEMMSIFSDVGHTPGSQDPSYSYGNSPAQYAPWYQEYSGEEGVDYSAFGGDNYEQPQWAEDIGSWYNPWSHVGALDRPEDYSFNFLPYVDIMSGSAIGQGLSEAQDLQSADTAFTPQTAITPDLIKRLQSSYYRPLIETQRQELSSQMRPKLGQARRMGSGFAGYGGRAREEEGIWNQFSAGMGQSFGQADELRGRARGEIGDIMNQWRQALQTA